MKEVHPQQGAIILWIEDPKENSHQYLVWKKEFNKNYYFISNETDMRKQGQSQKQKLLIFINKYKREKERDPHQSNTID